jgi:hypothetical protein
MDLQKVVRRVAFGQILFIIGSYALSFVPGFYSTIIKGSMLAIIVFPPIYNHYNDETKY